MFIGDILCCRLLILIFHDIVLIMGWVCVYLNYYDIYMNDNLYETY